MAYIIENIVVTSFSLSIVIIQITPSAPVVKTAPSLTRSSNLETCDNPVLASLDLAGVGGAGAGALNLAISASIFSKIPKAEQRR